MTHEELIEKGYHEYKPTPYEHQGVERVYQKCFRDNKGKKYFIDVKKWEDMFHPYTHELIPGGYEYETQLYKKGTHDPFNITFLSHWDIENVEEFVENLFQSGVLDYYEEF